MFYLFFNSSILQRELKKTDTYKGNRNIPLENTCYISISLEEEMQNLKQMNIICFQNNDL